MARRVWGEAREVLPLLRPTWPAGVRGVFTTRAGGVSVPPYAQLNLALHVGDDPRAVADNRALAAAAIGVPADRLAFAEQVHGNAVALLDAAPATPPAVDAMVTTTPGLALVVMVADCVPVLLADAQAGVVAVAHAGRKGVELGVVQVAVRAMVTRGADLDRLQVWLGPSIGGCCYEVPADMQAAVDAAAPGSACTTTAGTPGLDLRAGLETQLSALGVHRVGRVGGCTAETGDLFSYRRDATTGRFAGLIWLG
jgi:YfiH family protein